MEAIDAMGGANVDDAEVLEAIEQLGNQFLLNAANQFAMDTIQDPAGNMHVFWNDSDDSE